ncbi:MAG: DegT/DnrJ/EryC1/StrS family aminotransferase [Hyphomicrobiales bacterium]|nr:DegT/DnrJ/EryC1/StrS family aminotransferase [Hyphomicrobiales bacterium]
MGAAESAGQDKPISLYQPDLSGNERKYVLECIDSSWISSSGTFVPRFERTFADVIGAEHAIAVTNGTTALHLALHALNIRAGDEVIVPSFTYIASVNTIAQTGATPVFVDSRSGDWLLDPADVADHITPRTKAIMAVHLYGAVCDMTALTELASRHNLAIVEDCAEALGCTYRGRHVGTFGTAGTFSFYGNKTVTTGEGGMVVTADARLSERLRMLKGQGQSPDRRYWHLELGFNYRMTNICAAIGLAQLERLPSILARKRAIARHYRRSLRDVPVTFQQRSGDVESSDWLVSVLLPDGIDRDRVMDLMEKDGVETRPVFYCAHRMPMYAAPLELPVAEQISRRGISLPSYPQMTDADVDRVSSALGVAIEHVAGRRR